MTLNSVDLPQPEGPITGEEFARRHRERDVVDSGENTVLRLETLDDVLDHQEGIGGWHAGCSPPNAIRSPRSALPRAIAAAVAGL